MQVKTQNNKKHIFIWVWCVVIIMSVISFIYIDIPLATVVRAQKPQLWNIFLFNLTKYGRGIYYLLPAGVCVFLLYLLGKMTNGVKKARYYRLAWRWLFVITSISVAGLITNLIKFTLGRSRPRMFFTSGEYGFQGFNFDVDHWSFPSGHVTNVASFFCALLLITPPKNRLLLLPVAIFALLIITSRITVQAHYLSDVVFTTCWAATVTIIIYGLFKRNRLSSSSFC